MSCIRYFSVLRRALILLTLCVSGHASAQTPHEELFTNAVAGADCKQTLNNGLICEYKVGQKLSFSIKDAGGSDEVIGFRHSDINDDFYAVMYFGCIVVVPGLANQKKYGKDDGAFVAPKNGRVYRTRHECQSANK